MENEIIDTGIQVEHKSYWEAYGYLFLFLYEEHGLTLLNEEMDEIVNACDKFKKIFNEEERNNNTVSKA